MADVTSELLPALKKPKRIERDRVKQHPKKGGGKTNFGRSRKKKPSEGGSTENSNSDGAAKKSRGPRRRRKPSTPKADS